MLEYNAKKNILYAYRNPDARPSLVPDTSRNHVYESFREYCEKQCIDDVMNIFMPAFRDKLKVSHTQIDTTPDRISVKQGDAGFFNDLTHHVEVRFNVANCDNSQAEGISIMKLPHVNEDGTIEYDNKQYAFINMLEQQSAISYEDNKTTSKPQALKIKNERRSIWINDDGKKLKIQFSDVTNKTGKKKHTLIHLVMALARYEGYDVEELWNSFANFNIVNMFRDENEKMLSLYYSGGNTGTVNAADYEDLLAAKLTGTRLKPDGSLDDSYENSEVRIELNKLLSLDRAVGEELAKDVESVTNPGTILYNAGTIVDDNMVRTMQANGVYVIYVNYIPNTEGYFLCEDISIMYAPAGLKITESIRDSFPDEKGMYVSHTYTSLAVPIVYEAGTPLTDDIIDVLRSLGYEYLKVSDKRSGGVVKTLYFYEEIMSNRQVQGRLIGKDDDDWYYLTADKTWRKNDGSYTTYDFAALQSFCIKLFDGKWIERVVNLDDGFRKRLVPLSTQYHRAFEYAVREGLAQMNRKLKLIYTSSNGFNYLKRDLVDNEFYPFEKFFWEYLRDMAKCIQPLSSNEITNPISYQSACTKVNVYTANSHSVSDSQRGVAIGSFGKIDPFEIPQSQKMGVVYNATCGVQISTNGTIRTAYHPIIKSGEHRKILLDKIQWMTVEQEEEFIIGDICSLQYDSNGDIKNLMDIVTCRVPSVGDIEKHTFRGRRVRDIQYVNTDATQSLSWTSSCIPFMSSNDSARVIFADAQLKQAKGLIEPEEPDVMTSAYEQYPFLNNKYCIVAKAHGYVADMNNDIGYFAPTAKKDARSKRYDNCWYLHVIYDGQDGITSGTTYYIPEYFDSGSSVTKTRVCVKPGQEVNVGDILVCSNFVSENGIMTIGVNALTAYICDGFNYEDGVHISESLCDRLSSYRINHEEWTGSPRTTRAYTLDKTPKDWWYDNSADSAVDVSYISTDKSGRQHQRKIPKESYGFFENSKPVTTKDGRANYGLDFQCVSIDPFTQGDKLSNRHGNKGVASRIEKPCNMGRLKNGMALELTHNPLGVGSRMNIGQVLECHSGLVSHVLGIRISSDAYNPISQEELHELMSLTVDLMNSTGDPSGVLSNYGNLPAGLLQRCKDNINNIRRYAGCFDKDGTTHIMLPDNNGRMTETKVLLGYIYVFKLVQEAHAKAHARGGETQGEVYGEVTNAPTQGKAKGGGQRFGTMEIAALSAMGASGAIHEVVNERCDNAIARNNFLVNTYLPPNLRQEYLIDSRGQRRSTTQFLYTLLALGVMPEAHGNEFLPLSANNGEELAHWKSSVIQRANANYMKNFNANKKQEEAPENQDAAQNARDLILGKMKGLS